MWRVPWGEVYAATVIASPFVGGFAYMQHEVRYHPTATMGDLAESAGLGAGVGLFVGLSSPVSVPLLAMCYVTKNVLLMQ